MLSDNLLEYNPQWKTYSDPGIGNPPTSMSVTPASFNIPNMVASITGPKYTNMMTATHRAMPIVFDESQVYYSYAFTLMTDQSVSHMQVHESEARLYYIDSKGVCRTFNNSLQLNQVNPKGMIQAYAAPPNPVWTDTGIVIPNLQPNIPYEIEIDYLADMINNVFSTLAITINGKQYELPALFQKVPGLIQTPAWTPGVYCQFQLGLNAGGGSMTTKYNNVAVNWK